MADPATEGRARRGAPESIENNYRRSDTPAIVRRGIFGRLQRGDHTEQKPSCRRCHIQRSLREAQPSFSPSSHLSVLSLSLLPSSSIRISLSCGLRSRATGNDDKAERACLSDLSTRWFPRFNRCTLVRATRRDTAP